MSNLGAAVATYDTKTSELKIRNVGTFSPQVSKSKQVRQSSKDLDKSVQLFKALLKVVKGADVVCVELPTGSQTA